MTTTQLAFPSLSAFPLSRQHRPAHCLETPPPPPPQPYSLIEASAPDGCQVGENTEVLHVRGPGLDVQVPWRVGEH